jgi:hypothetical protein
LSSYTLQTLDWLKHLVIYQSILIGISDNKGPTKDGLVW